MCGSAVTRLITSVSCTAQPTREQASVTDDTCGSTATRSAPYSRIRTLPTPCSSGSPLATTCTSPSAPSSSVRSAGSIGRRPRRAWPRDTLSSSRSSWRARSVNNCRPCQFGSRRGRQPGHAVGADADHDDHRAASARPNRGIIRNANASSASDAGTHTCAGPRPSARTVASATCRGRARQRRGRHAFGHPPDHETGPHQQQPHPGAVQCVGQPRGEPVEPQLGRTVDVVRPPHPRPRPSTRSDDAPRTGRLHRGRRARSAG